MATYNKVTAKKTDMTYTFIDFDKAKSKAKSKKNCVKGMPCGFGCISKTKKCKKRIFGGGGDYADHITDPANLEKGAGSSANTEIVFADFELDENLNPVALSPESKTFVEKFNKWESAQKEDDGDLTLSQKLNKNAPPPTEEQAKAINTYTSSMYRDINGLLRGKKDFADPEYKQQVQDIADKAAEGLRSLPDYKGETYRGTALSNDIVAKMKVGGTYSDKGFLSTSSNLDIANNFAGLTSAGQTRVFFTVNGKHGKDISSASKFSNEKEILFNPSSKFKITSMEEKDGILQVGIKQYGKQK